MCALSIRHSWAWLIVNGYKPIDNRDWSTTYRGEFLIHASKTCARRYYDEEMASLRLQFGSECPPVRSTSWSAAASSAWPGSSSA